MLIEAAPRARLCGLSIVALIATTVAACGHEAGQTGPATIASSRSAGATKAAPPGSDTAAISVSDGLSPAARAAWMAFALSRLSAFMEGTPPARNGYLVERQSRTTLAEVWIESRADGAPADPYLDQLAAVHRAGWMREYVITTFAEPGWIIPAADAAALKLADYRRWSEQHIAGHRPVTLAEVHTQDSPAATAIPGATLPDAAAIDPKHVPCPRSRAALAEAVRRWTQEEAAIKEVPLSASSREQVTVALDRLRGDPRVKDRGVVLVSPNVMETLFVAGFCAVEGGRNDDAERLLARAVALAPASANLRGEHAHVLTGMKRLDEAEREVDTGIDLATDHCHLGMLWRKRGYILIDRGKLVDAYAAYSKSLEYDPYSDIPRREMSFIVSQLRQAGGYDAKALKNYEPPPMGAVRVTECR